MSPGKDYLCQNEPEIQWFRSKEVINCGLQSQIERTFFERKEKNILETLEKIEKSNPFFHVFPVHNFLCDEKSCPSHIDNIRLYRDNSGHLSLIGAKKFLGKEMRSIFLKIIDWKK